MASKHCDMTRMLFTKCAVVDNSQMSESCSTVVHWLFVLRLLSCQLLPIRCLRVFHLTSSHRADSAVYNWKAVSTRSVDSD